ncbi:MAG: hypothetical protein HQ515_02440, partial [Phycisphaeraceae bacterium]|nr:hypothetical protein [Phycisphaeraceae bacterium]
MVLNRCQRRCSVLIPKVVLILLLAIAPGKGWCSQITTETIGKDLTVVRGAVNGILLDRHGKLLAVYGDPRPET